MKKLFLLLTAIVLCSSMSFARLSGDQDNSSLKGNLSHIYDLKMDKSNLLKSKVNDSTVSIKKARRAPMAYDNRLAGFDYFFDHFVWNDVTKSSPATGVIRLSGGSCLDDYCWDYIDFGINFYVPSGVNYIPTGAYTVSSTGAVGTVAQGPSECNTSNAGFFKDVDAYQYTNFWWFFKSGFV